MPHSSEYNKDIVSGVAGSEVLIVYFAKLGASEVEKTVDLDYVDLLLKSGKLIVNYSKQIKAKFISGNRAETSGKHPAP